MSSSCAGGGAATSEVTFDGWTLTEGGDGVLDAAASGFGDVTSSALSASAEFAEAAGLTSGSGRNSWANRLLRRPFSAEGSSLVLGTAGAFSATDSVVLVALLGSRPAVFDCLGGSGAARIAGSDGDGSAAGGVEGDAGEALPATLAALAAAFS